MADYLPTSIKNLNTKLGEQLTDGGGGGGSSDFSTATVTVVDNVGRNILLPIIMDDDGQEFHSIVNLGISESGDYTVPLYKSSLTGRVNAGSGSISVTGSIAYLDGMIIVTGDGTITVS